MTTQPNAHSPAQQLFAKASKAAEEKQRFIKTVNEILGTIMGRRIAETCRFIEDYAQVMKEKKFSRKMLENMQEMIALLNLNLSNADKLARPSPVCPNLSPYDDLMKLPVEAAIALRLEDVVRNARQWGAEIKEKGPTERSGRLASNACFASMQASICMDCRFLVKGKPPAKDHGTFGADPQAVVAAQITRLQRGVRELRAEGIKARESLGPVPPGETKCIRLNQAPEIMTAAGVVFQSAFTAPFLLNVNTPPSVDFAEVPDLVRGEAASYMISLILMEFKRWADSDGNDLMGPAFGNIIHAAAHLSLAMDGLTIGRELERARK